MIDFKKIEEFDIKESSKKTYFSVAKKLNSFIGKTKITHFKRMMNLLNKKIESDATRLNYLKLLSKLTKNNKKLNVKYMKEIDDLNNTIKSNVPKKLKKLKEETKDIDYKKIKNDFIKGIREDGYDKKLIEFVLYLYL